MKSFDPYLHFAGNAETAMNFYKSVFGGTFTSLQRYKDMEGHKKMNTEDLAKLIHIALQIPNGITLMATDVLTSMEIPFIEGNNFHICIQAENNEEVNTLFNKLAEKGKIEMPLNQTFWGAYFGMCRDQFGIQWMINCNNK